MTQQINKICKALIKEKPNYPHIIQYILKYPSILVISTIIITVLIEITGYNVQKYLEEILPFSAEILDVLIDSIFAVVVLSILSYFIRKYVEIKKDKMNTDEHYASVINNIKEAVFQTDFQGQWTFLNPAWSEITGYSIEESLGKNFIEFVHPEDREKNMQLFLPLIERKKEYCRHEIRYLAKDLDYRWVEVFARLTLDSSGNILGTSGTLMDITDRKVMEQKLIKKEHLLQSIANTTATLLTTTALDEAFTKSVALLGQATMTDRVYIFQNHLHPNTQKIVVSQKYEWCNEGIEPQIHNSDLQEICYEKAGIQRWYETLSAGNTISGFVKDFPCTERAILEPQGVITLAVVPIFVNHIFWGFLGFDDCSRHREWSNSEIALLYTAAASIGGAVKRAEDEERIQRLLKNDFKQTVQNLQNLVFKCKQDDNNEIYFTLFEGRLSEKFGVTTERVFEKKLSTIQHFKTVEGIMDHFKLAFKGEICNFETTYQGNTYYASLSPIIRHNKVVEVVGSAIDITDLKIAEKQIRYMAYYDGLTGLPNRTLFKEQMAYMMSHAHRNHKTIAIMFLDLDRFKLINDTLGHAAGDELLKQTASRLKQVVHEDDMVVRMGGDEFIIVFPEVSSEGQISHLAKTIIDVFKEPYIINGHEFHISTSIGISMYPLDGNDIDLLIKNADTAMYRAKENGRNNYQFYTEDMNKRALQRLEIENNLRRALEREELFVVYQPRIDLKSSRLIGAEALLRWRHPTMGLISPAMFIPIAEETGLIHQIGRWVLYTACKQAKGWYDNGHSDFKISVNVSAVQFQKEGIHDIVNGILSETGLKPSMLELEITENTVMQKTEKTIEMIDHFKEKGIQISIDDFGTGFSSLSYIKQFQSNNLKIDKSFINDIGSCSSNESIISAIISMAHGLGMTVVAEGVETIEQLKFLQAKGCDEVQGYLFSKPILPEEFQLLFQNKLFII